jgi:hypothetical protein
MSTTTDERGILNNFAKEPKMYVASSPSPKEQRRYALQGTVAAILITALVLLSVAVS